MNSCGSSLTTTLTWGTITSNALASIAFARARSERRTKASLVARRQPLSLCTVHSLTTCVFARNKDFSPSLCVAGVETFDKSLHNYEELQLPDCRKKKKCSNIMSTSKRHPFLHVTYFSANMKTHRSPIKYTSHVYTCTTCGNAD